MRKTGITMLFSGAFLALLLYFARESEWFASEQARGFSDFAELVESAFWAALVTMFLGLVFLLLSYRSSATQSDAEAPAPLERFWVCPGCGSENPEEALRCSICGNPRRNSPTAPWICPVCGTENPEQLSSCQLCNSPRGQKPARSWTCSACGQENPETQSRCSACLRRRNSGSSGWVCPVCGSANAAGDDRCTLCETPRQRNLWTCGYCQQQNPADRAVCSLCGKARNAVHRSWLCPNCGTENRAERTKCVGCGQSRR